MSECLSVLEKLTIIVLPIICGWFLNESWRLFKRAKNGE